MLKGLRINACDLADEAKTGGPCAAQKMRRHYHRECLGSGGIRIAEDNSGWLPFQPEANQVVDPVILIGQPLQWERFQACQR